MRKFIRYVLLTICFVSIVTVVSVSLPPGFLLPDAYQSNADKATVVSLEEDLQAGKCFIMFDFEGENIEIAEPLSECSRYEVGQKVKV